MKFPLDEHDAKFAKEYDEKYSTTLYSYLTKIRRSFLEHSSIMQEIIKKISDDEDRGIQHGGYIDPVIERYNAVLEHITDEYMNILNEIGRDSELKVIYGKLSTSIERRYVFRDVLLLNCIVLGDCVEYGEFRKRVLELVDVLTGIMRE